MTSAWSDTVYPLRRPYPFSRWLVRWLLCDWFQRHVMGAPQSRRPTDLTLSHGPCRRCGGEHYWREGLWIATYE